MSLLSPAVLLDGRIVGTWKRKLEKKSAVVSTTLSRAFDRAESKALRDAVDSYGDYLKLPARLSSDP
jgi:hypothetical protein